MKGLLFSCFLVCAGVTVMGSSCSKTATTTTTAVLTPLEDVGCSIETAVTGGMASTVASALTCTNVAAIQASLVTAMGNVNICAKAPAVTVQSKGLVKTQGLIGNIACPIAITTVVGFLTNSIPTTWGCSANATVAALTTALTAACEAAIPI